VSLISTIGIAIFPASGAVAIAVPPDGHVDEACRNNHGGRKVHVPCSINLGCSWPHTAVKIRKPVALAGLVD